MLNSPRFQYFKKNKWYFEIVFNWRSSIFQFQVNIKQLILVLKVRNFNSKFSYNTRINQLLTLSNKTQFCKSVKFKTVTILKSHGKHSLSVRNWKVWLHFLQIEGNFQIKIKDTTDSSNFSLFLHYAASKMLNLIFLEPILAKKHLQHAFIAMITIHQILVCNKILSLHFILISQSDCRWFPQSKTIGMKNHLLHYYHYAQTSRTDQENSSETNIRPILLMKIRADSLIDLFCWNSMVGEFCIEFKINWFHKLALN